MLATFGANRSQIVQHLSRALAADHVWANGATTVTNNSGESLHAISPSWSVSRRSFHQSNCLCRFYESNPRGEYKNRKLHKEMEKMQLENLWGFKDGFKDLRYEVLKWTDELKDRYLDDTHLWVTHGDVNKLWTFDNPESLNKWSMLCDNEHNEGFSKCELTIGPTGKALFQGFINTTPPKDGRVKSAGYCIMKANRPVKSFGRKFYHDWTSYTHLVMRVRGDGRSYIINISTAGYYDVTWNDSYHYVLHTRGGPYWQYVKIPFSKFIFGSKGRIQDGQGPLPKHRVGSVQLAAGKVDGPFCLEVDYIGVECDLQNVEEFAYETYQIPKFIAGV